MWTSSCLLSGCCAWRTHWCWGYRGNQELRGARLEASSPERSRRSHVLHWEGERKQIAVCCNSLSVINRKFIWCKIANMFKIPVVWFHWLLWGYVLPLARLCGPQCISGTDTWQRVNTGMPVKSPRFALFDLAEGKSYNFRVRCCNSAGVGESSVPTGEITVGDKLGETCIYIM